MEFEGSVLGVVGVGGMGELFAHEMEEDFREVWLFDKDIDKIRRFEEEKESFVAKEDLEDVGDCDVFLVAVPIDVFQEVIDEVEGLLGDCLLFDVCSVKEMPVECMREAFCGTEVSWVGTHPLFGPSSGGFMDERFVLVGDDGEALDVLGDYFRKKGGVVEELEAGEHDRCMALVQGLSHLVLACFGKTLKKEREDFCVGFERLMTPTSRILYRDVQRIYRQDPRLFALIQANNRYVEEVCGSFLECFDKALGYVREGDLDELVDLFSGSESD